jgi:hypothetical protein
MSKSSLFWISLAVFSMSVSSSAQAPVSPTEAPNYSLVFYDDFTNLNLAADALTGEYPWYRGIWYESLPTPFKASVSSSALKLTWNTGQSPADTTISSCSQDGLHCRAFRYGYFEARMKWDVATGAWPAFWMIPVQNIWGASETGELDIFEGQGDPADSHTYFGTIHDWVSVNGTSTDIANNLASNSATIPGVDFTQWHKYGVLWVPGTVTWYFDDVQVLTAPTYPIFDQQYFYLMLGEQEGVGWQGGNTTGVTAKNLSLSVDWVKVWQP